MSLSKGDRVRCVDAKESGIPLREGEVYTIKRRWARGSAVEALTGEATIAKRAHIPAVTLEEVPGYFMETRFEALDGSSPEA